MSTFTNEQPVLISIGVLRQRVHIHSDVATQEAASRFKTGVLDVELLKAALYSVPSCLDECSVVSISYAGSTMSNLTHKREGVFNAFDARGEHIGTYFSSAFKSFAR